jgi:ribosome-binding factor A
VLAGLKAATPFVKGELSRRMKMRRTPELVFLIDRGLEQGMEVLGLLQRLEQERQERPVVPAGSDQLEGEGS